MSVTLEEHYTKTRPRLVELLEVVDPQGAPAAGFGRLPSWQGSTTDISPDVVHAEVQRLLDLNTFVGFWSAWRLVVTAAPDSDLAAQLLALHRLILQQQPDASLWLVSSSPTILQRRTVLRALFAADHAPELIRRPPSEFVGFESARGLTEELGVSASGLSEIFCAWLAPWLIGITAGRAGSALVTLTGSAWDGIDASAPAAEMLQLFASDLLVETAGVAIPRPVVSAPDVVRAFSWWVQDVTPGQRRQARQQRGQAIAATRAKLEAWRAEHADEQFDPEHYKRDILPGLATVPLPAIMAACGIAKATASTIRSGKRIPPARHWDALARLSRSTR